MPSNILNLPAYTVLALECDEHDYHIKVEVVEPLRFCKDCGSGETVSNGRRRQLVKDLPSHGKRVGIYIQARRLKCKSCNTTFTEPLPEISDKHEMTNRLVTWIQKQSIQRTFASVAAEAGLDEGTIRRIFNAHVEALEKTVSFETPEYLGIDEIHISQARCVLTNIQAKTIVDMLPDRSKKTVINYLSQMEDRQRVELCTMDMWRPYREAVQVVLPKAIVVVDKFHVVRLASDAMEKARRQIKDGMTDAERKGLKRERYILRKRQHDLNDFERLRLDGWLKNYPLIGAAYSAKESFFAIYDATSPAEAKRLFRAWLQTVEPEIKPFFSDLVKAWINWEDYILTYFTHPVTNATTEGINNLIRVIDRLGRGYSFEALRAKILYTKGIHCEKKRPKFSRREVFGGHTYGVAEQGAFESYVEKSLGVDIDALVKMIEDGRF